MNKTLFWYHWDQYHLSIGKSDYKQASIHYLTLLENGQKLPPLMNEVSELIK